MAQGQQQTPDVTQGRVLANPRRLRLTTPRSVTGEAAQRRGTEPGAAREQR